MIVIWTRAIDDWLRDRGYLPVGTLHIPCVRRVPLIPPVMECHPFPYAVVSSVAAVRALSRLPKLQRRLRDSTFFCFGQQTANELSANGYQHLLCPVPSSAELTRYLTDRLPSTTTVAVLSAKQPAFPTAEQLRVKGFKVSEFVLYQTIAEACFPDGSAINTNQRTTIVNRQSVICFASPSAVQGFNKVFCNELDNLKKNFQAIVMGKTTARQLVKSLPSIPYYLAENFTITSLIKTALRFATDLPSKKHQISGVSPPTPPNVRGFTPDTPECQGFHPQHPHKLFIKSLTKNF